MRIDILTLFPEFFSTILNHSITGKAVKNGILEYNFINIRDYANDKHNRVDDYPFSGGPGMLIKPEPVFNAYSDILRSAPKKPTTIYMSPRGKVFNQKIANELSKEEHLVILCGHYEGVDQRVIDQICDYELSIGDFVLTGGEIAALTVCDAVSRLVPGVLSETESFENESHYNGLLEFSQYTRPRVFNGVSVPDVLISGNSNEIEKWRYNNSVEITKLNRPDLYENYFNEKVSTVEPFSINLLLLGDETYCRNKIAPEFKSQLKKRNILLNNLFINDCTHPDDNLVIIICGESQFDGLSINSCNHKLIFGLRENDTIALKSSKMNVSFNLNNFHNKFEFNTIYEISDKILNFVLSLKIKSKLTNNSSITEIFDSCFKIEFLKPVPHDAYENNLSKFRGYDIKDLFIIDFNKNFSNEFQTLIVNRKAYKVQLFKLKTKELGTKYCIAVKNFENIYTQNIDSDFYICKNDYTDIFNDAVKLI